MNIDLNAYSAAYPTIRAFAERNRQDSVCNLINRASLLAGVPLIVSAHFIGMTLGYCDEVNRTIEVVTKFYNYEKVTLLNQGETHEKH